MNGLMKLTRFSWARPLATSLHLTTGSHVKEVVNFNEVSQAPNKSKKKLCSDFQAYVQCFLIQRCSKA
jgi:hypothetical protein